jgi:DNA-binding NarL/FixJ family response regulator
VQAMPPTDSSTAVRVLIVEDHPLTGFGTAAVLTAAGLDVVGVARSGALALDMARRHAPAVVVLDLQLPDMNGVSVAKELLQQQPDICIVVVTGQVDTAYGKALSRMGIDGYLTKEADPQELVAAIHNAVRGRTVRGATPRQAAPALSDREREILALVAQGLTNAEIAERVMISVKAVEYHLSAMFQRFAVRNRTELTRQALAFGLI